MIYDNNELIFGIDIGTRVVVGIIAQPQKDSLKVLGIELYEHPERAMLDGQVHDIEKVSHAVIDIKSRFERRFKLTLDSVAIAAAGRTLETKQTRYDKNIDPSKAITQNLIKSVEMESIRKAQSLIDSDHDENVNFYCVGYDITNYYLNGYKMKNVLGHKSEALSVEVIATFLPYTVIDSLYAVMNIAGLKISSLTLEPIAALNVAIPADLRLLNLALVDIGAGTTDIALTQNGSVTAFGMVPTAGDEITEVICRSCVTDFMTGEKVKFQISSNAQQISYTDILGNKIIKKAEEIKKLIKPAVEELAKIIAEEILKYNKTAPDAIFLVGGGSQTNGIVELLANKLNMPADKVGIRTRDTIKNMFFPTKILSGPESITPIGIIFTAFTERGQNFFSVTVNDILIQLFNSKKLKASDALMQIAYDPEDLIDKRGKGLVFTFQGAIKNIKGKYGKSAKIYINDKPAALDSDIEPGDIIRVSPSQEGEAVALTALDILKYYGDYKKDILIVNGVEVSDDYEICQNDNLTLAERKPLTIEEQLSLDNNKTDDIILGPKPKVQSDVKKIIEPVNFSENASKRRRVKIVKNLSDQAILNKVTDKINPILDVLDTVEEIKQEDVAVKLTENAQTLVEESENNSEDTYTHEESIELPKQQTEDTHIPEEEDSTIINISVNGQEISLSGKNYYMILDIFKVVDVDTKKYEMLKPKGIFKLVLNHFPASFIEQIHSGDKIEFSWN